MKNFKNPIFIVGAVAFLIVAGLVWNYTETIKEQNKLIEDERAVKASCAKTASDFSSDYKDEFYKNCVLQNGINP